MKLAILFLVAIIGIALISSVPLTHTFAKISKEHKAIDKAISNTASWKSICDVGISVAANKSLDRVFHKDNNRCNGITPPPQPTSCPIGDFNHTKFVRVGVTADTKVAGKEFTLIHNCGVQINLVAGDLWYTGTSNAWFAAVEKLGWTKGNTDIAVGNHDGDGSAIKNWLGFTSTWNQWNTPDGKVDVFAINANTDFKCGSTQFNKIKGWIEGSDAWYKLVIVHQPFVTGKSTHANNGQFSCYNPLFKANGVDVVAQGHNHNNQLFVIDNIFYTVGGVGTHDSSGSLYKITSPSDGQGHTAIFTNDKDNAILFLDMQIDVPTAHKIIGNFVGLNGQILNSFQN